MRLLQLTPDLHVDFDNTGDHHDWEGEDLSREYSDPQLEDIGDASWYPDQMFNESTSLYMGMSSDWSVNNSLATTGFPSNSTYTPFPTTPGPLLVDHSYQATSYQTESNFGSTGDPQEANPAL
jgi:hypothetical protein